MFPTGIALLLLRVVVTATFLLDGTAHGTLVSSPWTLILYASIAASLVMGALTPYFSILIIILDLWAFHLISQRDPIHLAISMLNSGILALLGPGSYSVLAGSCIHRRDPAVGLSASTSDPSDENASSGVSAPPQLSMNSPSYGDFGTASHPRYLHQRDLGPSSPSKGLTFKKMEDSPCIALIDD
jgi:hypothetical protein